VLGLSSAAIASLDRDAAVPGDRDRPAHTRRRPVRHDAPERALPRPRRADRPGRRPGAGGLALAALPPRAARPDHPVLRAVRPHRQDHQFRSGRWRSASSPTSPAASAPACPQCRKCRTPVNTMARPGRVGGGDHLVVAHRAARLDDRGRARIDRRLQAVGEREERVGGDHRALGQRLGEPAASAASAALRAAMRELSTRLIWPAPMPTVAPSTRIDDGVRLDVLGDPEGEHQVGNSRSSAARFVTTRGRRRPIRPLSRSCTSRPPATVRTVTPGGPGIGQAAGHEQPQVLLRGDDRDRLVASRPAR
jgi:hypothetical protein